MQLEEMDDRIREAAENHHPAYNEKAWPEMEKLLDKHLPQKKDNRRRFLLLLLLLLLAGSGAWLLVNKPWQQGPVADSGSAPVDASQPGGSAPASPIQTGNSNSKPTGQDLSVNPSSAPTESTTAPGMNIQQPDNSSSAGGPQANLKTNRPAAASTSTLAGTQQNNPPRREEKAGNPTLQIETGAGKTARKKAVPNREPATARAIPQAGKESSDKAPVLPGTDQALAMNITPVQPEVPVTDASDKSTEQPKTIEPVKEGAKKENAATPEKSARVKKNRKGNNLAISFSVGPDISMIGFSKTGEVRTITGGGLSYTFGKRFTVSAGIFAARKVYTAAPADYKFSYRPSGYNYMTKIDGDCKVIEIPINFSWSFGKGKKGNWYAGAGVASLIMKKERYDYKYEYPSGAYYTYTNKISNENKHLFSILNISGGYRRTINRKMFVAAEPYLQIPMNSGVGAGKVKLNSAGVLFSVGIRPFAR